MTLRKLLHLPVTLQSPLAGEAVPVVAAEIFAPDPAWLGMPATVLFCLPGGGMNRNYFNLVLGDDASYSFAQHMVRQGCIAVTIDPLGVGDSTRPCDGYALQPEILAEANARAVEQVLDALRRGTLFETWPALPDIVSIGVAHSVGGMLTILQQVNFDSFDALALFGFSCSGLPQALKPEERQLAGGAGAARADLVRLARARFDNAYPEVVSSQQGRELFGKARVERKAVEALAPARDRLLALAATLAIIPGNIAPECAAIDVPLFLALGDLDFCGPPHDIPASFPKSPDVTLLVLPETGHTHFIFPSRMKLFQRFCDWARMAVAARPEVQSVAASARLGAS
jgi:pimeloyl-ACP methyl ester carboxylesterase